MVRGFKAKANRIAVAVRADLGLPATAPLDPLAVCQHFEIEVRPLSSCGADAAHLLFVEPSAFSAVTVPCGMRRAIIHNDGHSLVRQRSNIMHELAHGFLGHPPCSAFDCDGERNYDGGIESEANFLGGSLLVTNEAAWHIVRTGQIAQAKQVYGISQKMLSYRLGVSGALKRGSYSRAS